MAIYGKLGVINTNLMANAAYQGMESTNQLLSVHQNRIATLKKVNGSADDPAGYVMASGMKIEMDGMDVSGDNIANAQNMINIANNGASSIKNLLTEMRKKALEASDGSKSNDQRSAIQSQISQYLSEIQDSVSQTTWNGKILLDGNASFGFQTGPNSGDVTNLAIGLDFNLGLTQNRLANGLGATDIEFGALATDIVANGGNPAIADTDNVIDADWTIEFVGENSYNVSYTTPDSSESHTYGTTFTIGDTPFIGKGIDLTAFALVDPAGSKKFAQGDILTFSTKATRDNDHFDQTKSINTASSEYVQTQNQMIDATGVAGLDTNELCKPGDLVQYKIEVTEGSTDLSTLTGSAATLEISTRLYNEGEKEWGDWVTGDSVDVNEASAYLATFDGTDNDHHAKGLAMTVDATDKLTTGDTFTGTIQIQKDGHVVTDSDGVGVNLDGVAGQGVINLSTKNGAKASLNKLDVALSSVDGELGNMGAMSKRLDIKSNLMEGRKTQIGAAVSRVEDADLISEQLQIAKLQVLQQANLSLMSQAQQAPRMVLQIMGIGG